ncbi:MAG: hypothetical protein WDZ41_05215 [Candidatus Babeliales bacterium]
MILDNIKYFTKRTVIINEDSQSHLTKNLRYLLGEIAMYNIDQFFQFQMVPKTIIIKRKNNENQEIICGSQWIEPEEIIIGNAESLQKLITQQEWAQMNIICFLFGQYDRHFGNLIIEKDSKKLYLIDNEAIANVKQFVLAYSSNKELSCPWVGGVGDFIAKETIFPHEEPTDFLSVIAVKQGPEKIHASFPDVDTWTKLDIDNGYCRIWRNLLWRQFYASQEGIAAPFSEIISSALFKKLKALTAKDLTSFWPEIPFTMTKEGQQEYQDLIEQFIQKTLNRRDMIVEYFEKHSEKIREYK